MSYTDVIVDFNAALIGSNLRAKYILFEQGIQQGYNHLCVAEGKNGEKYAESFFYNPTDFWKLICLSYADGIWGNKQSATRYKNIGRCVIMIEIRYAELNDKDFWYSLDHHLPDGEYAKKVRDCQGYVIVEDGNPKGILRYHLFWDHIPFCAMIVIAENSQHKGYGRTLMEHWENDMRRQGYGMIMTSTQVDEDAQHFYRKLGYKDCGGVTFDIPGYEQPMELFLSKAL